MHEFLISEDFRKRPGMFIGNNSISALESFIAGFFYALYNFDMGEELGREEFDFQTFSRWVADYLGFKETTAGWCRMILKKCANDEEEALKKFFELYDMFLSKNE